MNNAEVSQSSAMSGILSLSITDKAVLFAAYMPFLRSGGIFVPSKKKYAMGEEVFILLQLMDEPDKIPVAGRVVWITPEGAQGHRKSGVGFEFSDQDDTAARKIETILASAIDSGEPTHTM